MNAVSQAFAETSERDVLAFPRCPTFQRLAQQHEPDANERVDLDRLRWLAMRSRLAPRPDLERACFVLAGESDVSFERFAIAFFRGLDARGSRPMEFYRPGARQLSDDEIWLMRLVSAWRRDEQRGAAALVSWRVQPAGRRWLRFLSAGMVRALDGGV